MDTKELNKLKKHLIKEGLISSALIIISLAIVGYGGKIGEIIGIIIMIFSTLFLFRIIDTMVMASGKHPIGEAIFGYLPEDSGANEDYKFIKNLRD